MCSTCAKSQVNITEGITTSGVIFYCKGCDRYQRPPWTRFAQESNDFMTFLLTKIKGLKQVKLIDTNFIWTEPHSKRKKIKITVQKEFNNSLLQSSLIIEFVEEWTQCDDCKKTFTPHLWNASTQVRQKVDHKRTFLYLEQIILKHKMHEKALNIKETPEGVDFFFKSRSNAASFADFVSSVLPMRVKESKRLISHDQWSNLYNYKYTYMIEIAPICKDDLIILDTEQMKELGGIGPLLLCTKVATNIHLLDPLTFEVIEFDSNNYWKHGLKSHIDRSTLKEFLIQNIEVEEDYTNKYKNNLSITITESDVDMDSKHNVSKSTNFKPTKKIHLENSIINNKNGRFHHNYKIVKVDCTKTEKSNDGENKLYSFRTHLGDKLRIGDVYYGYDVKSINSTTLDLPEDILKNLPDIVLVKKKFSRPFKRVWKLQRLNMDKNMIEEDELIEDPKENKKKNKNKNQKGAAKTMDENYEEFLKEIEENKDIRKNINIYKDDDALKELTSKFDKLEVEETIKKTNEDFGIDINNLMDNLTINEKKEEKDEFKVPESVDNTKSKKIKLNPNLKNTKEADKEKIETKKDNKKSNLKSKRDRKGSEIVSSGNEM